MRVTSTLATSIGYLQLMLNLTNLRTGASIAKTIERGTCGQQLANLICKMRSSVLFFPNNLLLVEKWVPNKIIRLRNSYVLWCVPYWIRNRVFMKVISHWHNLMYSWEEFFAWILQIKLSIVFKTSYIQAKFKALVQKTLNELIWV